MASPSPRLPPPACLATRRRPEGRTPLGLHGGAYRDYRRRVPMFFPWRFGR